MAGGLRRYRVCYDSVQGSGSIAIVPFLSLNPTPHRLEVWPLGKGSELISSTWYRPGPRPSPIESVLAETAATCWFAFRMHEAQYAGNITADGMSLAQSEHAQRRMDRAHRRFLSTVKTLAAVRRLAVPVLQINVARQQVNQVNAGGQS